MPFQTSPGPQRCGHASDLSIQPCPPNLFCPSGVSLVCPTAADGDGVSETAQIDESHETMTSASDATLFVRVRSGDGTATRLFYERHAPRVYRTAFRILRDRAASEEVTQDVFVRALSAIGHVREPAAAGAWLSSIAVRMAYDRHRAERRRIHRFIPIEQLRSTSAPASAEPLVADHVRQAIAQLSPKLQIVLVMYELEGHSHAEIAAALKIPVATSKTRLSQARAALRKQLAAYAPLEATHE